MKSGWIEQLIIQAGLNRNLHALGSDRRATFEKGLNHGIKTRSHPEFNVISPA